MGSKINLETQRTQRLEIKLGKIIDALHQAIKAQAALDACDQAFGTTFDFGGTTADFILHDDIRSNQDRLFINLYRLIDRTKSVASLHKIENDTDFVLDDMARDKISFVLHAPKIKDIESWRKELSAHSSKDRDPRERARELGIDFEDTKNVIYLAADCIAHLIQVHDGRRGNGLLGRRFITADDFVQLGKNCYAKRLAAYEAIIATDD